MIMAHAYNFILVHANTTIIDYARIMIVLHARIITNTCMQYDHNKRIASNSAHVLEGIGRM